MTVNTNHVAVSGPTVQSPHDLTADRRAWWRRRRAALVGGGAGRHRRGRSGFRPDITAVRSETAARPEQVS